MFRGFVVLVFFVGLLGYLGLFAYQQVFTVAIARGDANYYEGAKKARPTSVMTLHSCTPGRIPGVPSFEGSIVVSPMSARLPQSGKLRIINGDGVAHTVGVALTKIWEKIEPGDSLELSYDNLPKSGTWGITCDGIYLGERSPAIVVFEL